MKIAGIVMAGGESRRFGRPKAFAEFRGKPFYQLAVDALKAHTDEIILVSHPDLKRDFSLSNIEVIEDIPPYIGCGPLSGLYAAMQTCQADVYITLPCDMPLFTSTVTKALLQSLTSDTQAIVPVAGGRQQPLSAVYRASCLSAVQEQLATGNYRMKDFFSRIQLKGFPCEEAGIDPSAFQNINDQQTYETLIREHT